MTGDVTINPNANCIVMTTEILRSMIYRGGELMREVAWVVFDEIHYMQVRFSCTQQTLMHIEQPSGNAHGGEMKHCLRPSCCSSKEQFQQQSDLHRSHFCFVRRLQHTKNNCDRMRGLAARMLWAVVVRAHIMKYSCLGACRTASAAWCGRRPSSFCHMRSRW